MIAHATPIANLPRIPDGVSSASGDFVAKYDPTSPDRATYPCSHSHPIRDRAFAPSRPIPATHTTSADALEVEKAVAGEISVQSPVQTRVHGFVAPQVNNIPEALRVLPRWMTWRAEQRDGTKSTKVPYNPTLHNSRGSSTDPDTWGTLDQAVTAYEEGDYTGIGFALNDDGLVGVDIDHCVLDGEIHPDALALLDALGASYVELSPSTTGLRAFGYSSVLEKGCAGTVNGLKVELYSSKRFLTVTGKVIKDGAVSGLRGFVELAERIRADRKIDPNTGDLKAASQSQHHAALVSRIHAGDNYHDSLRDLAASLAASGMNGGAAVNHLYGLMDASAGSHDERWAARRADIPALVSSAMGKFAPSSVDISAIMHTQAPRAMSNPCTELGTNKTRHVPEHLLTVPGILGKMVDWTNRTANKPQPNFAVQTALALGSVVLGRKFCTTQRNWPNQFFLNIGVTGSGKEHAKTAIEECLRLAGLGQLIGACDYTSDAAVDSMLLARPTHISIMDEFGMLMESSRSKSNHLGATVRRRLMEVFGRAHSTLQPKAYSTAGLTAKQRGELGTREVVNPSLTLVAMTTPGTFFNAIGSGSMQDGFLNRFIIVQTDLGRQLSQDIDNAPPPQELTDWARSRRVSGEGNMSELDIDGLHNERATPTIVPFDEAASVMFKDLEQQCLVRMDELEQDGIADMYSRVREIAMKVSLIVSQSCESNTITAEHARWAIDYVTYWADRSLSDLMNHIADSPFGALCNDVARFINAAGPNGLTEADLARKTARFKEADERMRQQVFKNLIGDRGFQKVDFLPPSGRGKKRVAYVAAEFGDQPQ
ncbi:DUF3987 domain-containing protein [Massilia aquatica]|uniref:DUF3987 domain-containing protein n=1 Tax=Massilia aquatica TaxID=2609000 RepID=A0ABX0M924_9BURK|nr:DUF3987 domain-containing protein [Massilia aquatica]NHZ38661.1 DUF3987 domain-containing protein [Massilia aquatica]